MSTQALCNEVHLRFIPMVLEAHGGGWSKDFQKTIDWIAGKQALATGIDASLASTRIAQRISCTLQRVNAEAIIARRVGKGGWEEPAEEPDWIA